MASWKRARRAVKGAKPAIAAALREKNAFKARAALNPVRLAFARTEPEVYQHLNMAIEKLAKE